MFYMIIRLWILPVKMFINANLFIFHFIVSLSKTLKHNARGWLFSLNAFFYFIQIIKFSRFKRVIQDKQFTLKSKFIISNWSELSVCAALIMWLAWFDGANPDMQKVAILKIQDCGKFCRLRKFEKNIKCVLQKNIQPGK